MYLSLKNLLQKLEDYRQMTAQEQLHKIMTGGGDLMDENSKVEGSRVFLIADILVSFVFLIAEIIAVVYAVKLAFKCSPKNSPARTVNLLISVVHPIPYLLLNMLLNPCSREVLSKW